MGHRVAYRNQPDPCQEETTEMSAGLVMPTTVKKLFGTFALVALVVIYALVATAVATARLGDSPWWIHLLYFFFTGLLWVIPAMFIVRWMIRLPNDQG